MITSNYIDSHISPYAFALCHMRYFMKKFPKIKWTYEAYQMSIEELVKSWGPNHDQP